MRSYASNKRTVVIRYILTSDDTEPETYGLSMNQMPEFCRYRHNNKTTNGSELQTFTTESFLLMTALILKFSGQLFKLQLNLFIYSNTTLSYMSQCISVHLVF